MLEFGVNGEITPSLLHHFTTVGSLMQPKKRLELNFSKKSSHCSPTLISFFLGGGGRRNLTRVRTHKFLDMNAR